MLIGYLWLWLGAVALMMAAFLLSEWRHGSKTARQAEQRKTDLKRRADGAIPLRRERMK